MSLRRSGELLSHVGTPPPVPPAAPAPPPAPVMLMPPTPPRPPSPVRSIDTRSIPPPSVVGTSTTPPSGGTRRKPGSQRRSWHPDATPAKKRRVDVKLEARRQKRI